MKLEKYIPGCYQSLPVLRDYEYPWEITGLSSEIVNAINSILNADDCIINGTIAIHRTAKIGNAAAIKDSVIFKGLKIVHFNFVGDSIIREDVNLEAGSIVANYFNELEKDIELLIDNEAVKAGVKQFGSRVGDHSRIGANAVLDPGSVLLPGQIICRLEHYDQFKGAS